MRISRRAEYALRALLLIAKDQKEKIHQIQELSERGNIPVKFLEQILLHLRNEGLLTSKRGVGGGYSLRKRPSDIVVLDIVELLDGPIAPLPCALDDRANRAGARPDPLPVAPIDATDPRNDSRFVQLEDRAGSARRKPRRARRWRSRSEEKVSGQ